MCCEIRSITGAACAKRGQWQTAADGFRQANHVRLYAEVFAGAAPGKLCAGFHFVEDEQRAIFRGDIAQTLQKTGLRHAQADVHQNRLENNRGDLAGIFAETALDAAEIVEAGDDHVGERRFGHAAAAGDGVGRVGVAVVFGLGLDADERGVMQVRGKRLRTLGFCRGPWRRARCGKRAS